MIEHRLKYIQSQFLKFPNTVYIGYSGGKDSSAVLKLLYSACKDNEKRTSRFVVVYCDSSVENPIIDKFVKSTLFSLRDEAKKDGLPFECEIVKPTVDQSFFVRIIGRGYPPPTNSFRWCTKDIRIRPLQRYLRSRNDGAMVAIGTRIGESGQRDRSLRKSINFQDEEKYYQRQREGFSRCVLFTPIIDFEVADVWEALVSLAFPQSISAEALAKIYKDGGGECPTIRDFKDKPCSKARFGCWTCTVVRRDRSAERMIAQGHELLVPYYQFRQWLLDIRNNSEYRCRRRRSGHQGPGPFNLKARQMILEKLNQLEVDTGRSILTSHQRSRIGQLWSADLNSEQYAAIE